MEFFRLSSSISHTPSPDMRVALLTDADVFAGTERHILDLAVALKQLPDAPEVSITCPVPSPLADRAQNANIKTVAVAPSAVGVLHWPTVRVLRRLLQSHRVEILHAHNGRMALHATLAALLARRGKVIVTQHFLAPSQATRTGLKSKIFGVVHKFVNARAAHFIAISRAVEAEMKARQDAPSEKISTVLHALPDPLGAGSTPGLLRTRADVRKELQIENDVPLIVCASRLEREKGVTTLLAAMALLQNENIAARCIVAGEGEERGALETLIAQQNLQTTVQLLGFRSDVLSLLRAGDIFVLPSHAEGFGLAVLEAMALSRSTVVPSAGGPPEVIQSGVTGVLVPPADAQALAEALRELIENPVRREAMGIAGRKRYETHFQPQRMARSVREIYERVG
jgi:glycosyltransferase involved in cell wall biosynthesis